MQQDLYFSYYKRKEVQDALLKVCESREVAPRYGEGFGKRPDMLQFPGDVLEMAKKGATSFHISEERWHDPLLLKPGMSKKELDENRQGWDLILDIDTSYWDYAKWTAYFLIEALKFHDVKNISTKFSVSDDTPILIQIDENITQLLSINEVIEIFKKYKNIRVLSLDKGGKVCYAKVYDYLVHEDTLFELFHENSTFPLKVTKHHSVFCWKNGAIIEQKVADIRKGDYLISLRKAEKLQTKIPTIKYKYSFNQKECVSTIKINRDFMRLIGYYLSEGHATKSIYQVGFSFNINETEYIHDCTSILQNLYPTKKICQRSPNSGSLQVLIHSKDFYTLITRLCRDKKEKKVPDFSWALPKDYFLEMLKGYIRGDGSKKDKYSIVIKSVVKDLITQFVWLCKINGISCSLRYELNKPHMLPQGAIFKGSLVYMITIPKSELEMKEFHVTRNKFSPYPNDKLFPLDGLKFVFKQCKPKKYLKHRLEHVTLRKKQANFQRIEKLLLWFERYKSEDFSAESQEIIRNYQKAIQGDIATVMVKDIKVKGKSTVYDLSIEETERFFGNSYPVLLHNSGSKGFHIAVPFESFPQEVNGVKTQKLFPEGPRILAAYLQNMIQDMLAQKILEKESLTQICQKTGLKRADLLNEGKFDPFTVVEIDTILISNRHLFRAPYSLHEKTGLISLPIDIEHVLNFEKQDADPHTARIGKPFLVAPSSPDAKNLIIQAFDWWGRKHAKQGPDIILGAKQTFHLPVHAVSEDSFPQCIQKLLAGNLDDGKKRALFILVAFLRHMQWQEKDVETRLFSWNKVHKNPLPDSYIHAQLSWNQKQIEAILPPNCDKSHYKDLRVKCAENICQRFKNPVNCAFRLHAQAQERKKKGGGKT